MFKIGCTVQLKQKMFASPHAPKFNHLHGKIFEVVKIGDTYTIAKNIQDPTQVIAFEHDHIVLTEPAATPAQTASSGKKLSNTEIRRQLGWFMK